MKDTVMWQRLDPELVEPLEGLLEATGGGLDFNDIPGTREMLDGLVAALAAGSKASRPTTGMLQASTARPTSR